MTSLLIIFTASFLLWIMFGGVFVLWLFDGKFKKEAALHAIFASILVWVISEMIKQLIPTTRPFLINGDTIRTLTLHLDSSFPSTHTAVAFALASTIYLHDMKKGSLYFILATLVGLGRVFANVHFPLDIFFGAILGIITSYTIGKLHLFGLVKAR